MASALRKKINLELEQAEEELASATHAVESLDDDDQDDDDDDYDYEDDDEDDDEYDDDDADDGGEMWVPEELVEEEETALFAEQHEKIFRQKSQRSLAWCMALCAVFVAAAPREGQGKNAGGPQGVPAGGRRCDERQHGVPHSGGGGGGGGVTTLLQRPPHTNSPPHTNTTASWQKHPPAFHQSGPLSPAQVAAFYADGFLVLPGFYGGDEVSAAQAATEGLVGELAEDLYAAGKVSSAHAEAGWTSRLLRLQREHPDTAVNLIKGGKLPVAFRRMMAAPKMLDAAAQLGVGWSAEGETSIALNAAWNLRAKMPAHEQTAVPWHQDNSYWEPRLWHEQILTVWVALVDATVGNGCLEFVRGAHRTGRTASHTIGTTTATWYTELDEATIRDELCGGAVELDVATVEVKAGSAIIFGGNVPHRSRNSNSSDIRWSLDWRLHAKTPSKGGFKGGDGELDWFYGLKDSLLLRDGSRPIAGQLEPDWDGWLQVDRTAVQDGEKGIDAQQAKRNFDPIIVGPWMDLWNITTDKRGLPNPHVDRYLASPPESRDVEKYIRAGNW